MLKSTRRKHPQKCYQQLIQSEVGFYFYLILFHFQECFVLFPMNPVSFLSRVGGKATIFLSPLFGSFWLLSSLTRSELSCRNLSLSSGGGDSRIGVLGSPHLPNSYTASPGLSHIAFIHPQAQSSFGGGGLVETPARTKHIHLECSRPTDRQVPLHWSQQALTSPLYRVGVPETLNEREQRARDIAGV